MNIYHFFTILLVAPFIFGCGREQTISSKIDDGQILLLNSSKCIAIVRIEKQEQSPEVITFSWKYRNDGIKEIPLNDMSIQSGRNTKEKYINFKNIKIDWSVHGNGGSGYIYHNYGINTQISPPDLKIKIITKLPEGPSVNFKEVFND